MKVIFILLYFFIILVTISLCKAAKRADERMEEDINEYKKKNT